MAAYAGDDDMEDVQEREIPRATVRSQIVRTQKGRGFREREREDNERTKGAAYDRDAARGPGPAKCMPRHTVAALFP